MRQKGTQPSRLAHHQAPSMPTGSPAPHQECHGTIADHRPWTVSYLQTMWCKSAKACSTKASPFIKHKSFPPRCMSEMWRGGLYLSSNNRGNTAGQRKPLLTIHSTVAHLLNWTSEPIVNHLAQWSALKTLLCLHIRFLSRGGKRQSPHSSTAKTTISGIPQKV